MAYVPPTFDASGQTYAQLQNRGFEGYVVSYVAALTSETPTANANEHVGKLVRKLTTAYQPMERARAICDAISRKTISKATAETEIYDLQLAFGAIATSLAEIGALADANLT